MCITLGLCTVTPRPAVLLEVTLVVNMGQAQNLQFPVIILTEVSRGSAWGSRYPPTSYDVAVASGLPCRALLDVSG